jgi:4-amino-4-deoxy-L-arabinose transferase-like glycosyltransferase
MQSVSAGGSRADTRSYHLCFVLVSWALLVLATLVLRPLTPVDETRYASVAWEMWLRGDLLVPHLNGLPYSDKPPLLFWLIQAGWWAFGVSDWWPRLVPALFGLANLFLTRALARRLWPDRDQVAAAAPVVLIGLLLWAFFLTFLMFDLLVTFFDLVALLGILTAWRGRQLAGWALVGAALGLGILAKGPVALLAPLLTALLAPWWSHGSFAAPPVPTSAVHAGARGWASWYLGMLAAVALAAAIALSWALPAVAAGGPAYADALLFHQTEGRIVQSFAHQRPWWWYGALLPLLLAPFSLWPPLWRAVLRLRPRQADLGLRLCFAWVVPALAAFSLISGKQPHYLLPLFPALALIGARLFPETHGHAAARTFVPPLAVPLLIGSAMAAAPLLAGRGRLPSWLAEINPGAGLVLVAATVLLSRPLVRQPRQRPLAFALLSLALVLTVHAGFVRVATREYDVVPMARYLRRLEATGVPVAYVGNYHGQFQFLGRLRRPLQELTTGQAESWLRLHPDGRLVAERRHIPPNRTVFEFVQPYRDDFLAVWSSASAARVVPSG